MYTDKILTRNLNPMVKTKRHYEMYNLGKNAESFMQKVIAAECTTRKKRNSSPGRGKPFGIKLLHESLGLAT